MGGDARARALANHYCCQIGGSLPVFKGGQFGGRIPVYAGVDLQYGNGFGDILRGLFRWLVPVIAPMAFKTAGSFVSNTLKARDEGKDWGESMKSSISPALGTLVESGGEAIKRKMSGAGRKRRRKAQKGGSRAKRRRIVRQSKKKKINRRRRRRVYKHPRKRRAKRKNIKQTPSNF